MFLFVVMRSLLLLLSISSQHLVEASRNIPITKCCQDESVYKQGFDSCEHESDQSVSWPPSVYSEELNQINKITKNDLNVTTAMDNCPVGQIAVSTNQFKFFINGSMRLNEGGQNFIQAGQFCLMQVFGSAEIVARFCAPDPCTTKLNYGSAGCIHKCCPSGKEINPMTFSCQPSSSLPFVVKFTNRLGELANQQNLSSYVIRDGVIPKCIYGMNPLGKSFGNDEPFNILPNGHIYVPGYPENYRMESQYCIDTDSVSKISHYKIFHLKL